MACVCGSISPVHAGDCGVDRVAWSGCEHGPVRIHAECDCEQAGGDKKEPHLKILRSQQQAGLQKMKLVAQR